MDKIKEYFEEIFGSIHFGWWIFGVITIDIFSFHVNYLPALQIPVFIILCLILLGISLYNLHTGLLLVLAELCIGSKGYLFSIEVAGIPLSIRLAGFLIILFATVVWMIREKRIAFFHWSLWKPYTIAIAAITFGVLVGIVRGNDLSTIFFDVNGYLYFGLVFTFVQAVHNRKHVTQLLAVMIAGVIALSIKTLFLLLLFSHIQMSYFTVMGIYEWVRDTGVGEITRFPNGFARIFIQSQIYMLIAFFFIAPWFVFSTRIKEMRKDATVKKVYGIIVLSTAVIMLNYSRSFWAASIATLFLLAVWFLTKERMPLIRLFGWGAGLFGTVALSYALIFAIINLPLPGHTLIDGLFAQRTKNLGTEAAAASRWNLLRPLGEAALQHPLIGSGLGSTITYNSQDPRVLETHPDGRYTTYAFEWGYLDLAFKFGILGLVALGYLIISIVKKLYSRIHQGHWQHIESVGALASLLALLGTHFFTPYLNHPLGIGWILVLSVIAAIPVYQTNK